MQKVKIDKGIAIPENISTHKYPFIDMEVGDSFLVPAEKRISASGAITYYGKKLNMKFTRRTEGGGMRVWRIE